MISFKTFITEAKSPFAVMKEEGVVTEVYRILTGLGLRTLLNAITSDIRGVWKDGALFCWDSSDATHHTFETTFGKGTVNIEIYKGKLSVTKGSLDSDKRLSDIISKGMSK